MNKTLLFSIIGVVVVGVGAYFIMGNQSTGGQEGSLKELLASPSPQKCTFETQPGMTDSSGEVFVAGGKMRSNFVSVANGQTINSHMIVSDNAGYVWTDTTNQGFKISLEAMTKTETDQKQGVDINQKLKYTCSPWSENAGTFALPQGVTFSDMSALINRAMPSVEVKTSGNGKVNVSTNPLQEQCGACDQVTDAAAKAQCRTALGCK